FDLMKGLMPDFIAEWTHMGAASFQGFVLFGYSDPVVHVFLAAIAISVGLEPVAEIESRFVDLLMARPIPRSALVLRSVLVLLVVTEVAIVSMFTANEVSLYLLTPSTAQRPALGVVASLATGLGFLMLAWGSIAVATSAWSRRRATAGAICGFLAFAMFVLD